jgi:hypothetical protein
MPLEALLSMTLCLARHWTYIPHISRGRLVGVVSISRRNPSAAAMLRR